MLSLLNTPLSQQHLGGVRQVSHGDKGTTFCQGVTTVAGNMCPGQPVREQEAYIVYIKLPLFEYMYIAKYKMFPNRKTILWLLINLMIVRRVSPLFYI